MKRQIFFLVVLINIGILTTLSSLAEYKDNTYVFKHPDTLINYFDKSGSSVPTKAESYSYRIISPIGNNSEDLSQIVSYYTETDSIKSMGYGRYHESLSQQIYYIGELVSYYPKGQMESLQRFDGYSQPIDSSYYYYPNGKLRMLTVHEEFDRNPFTGTVITKPYYLLYMDSIGNYLLKRGNGFVRFDNEDSSYIEGELKDNKREGLWKGWNMGAFYEEFYVNDSLVNGKRFRANGEVVSYDVDTKELIATPPIKIEKFVKTIEKIIDVPQHIIDQTKGESISVSFIIDKEGRVGHFKYNEDVHYKIRIEITKAIENLGQWNPARVQGEPVAISYTMSIRL